SVSTEEISKIPALMQQRDREVVRLVVEGGYYAYDALWAFFRPNVTLPASFLRYLEKLKQDPRCELVKEGDESAASSPLDSNERSWFSAYSDRSALLTSDNPCRVIKRFSPEIVIIGTGELRPFIARLLTNGKRFSVVTSPQVINQMRQWKFPNLDSVLAQRIEVGPVHYRCVQEYYQIIKAQEPELIIGIGMGSVTDWAKVLGHKLDKEVVIIPSAVSTNAMFTANIAIRDGERDSFEVGGALTGAVREVIIDSDFVRLNPRGNIAGAGDLLSSIVALSDWRLAIKFGRESEEERKSRDYVYRSTEALIDELIYFARQIKENRNEGIEKSARLAWRVSEFMDMVHSGRPKAGSEHILSDTLEKEAQGRKILHGEQVALATILMSYFHGLDYKNILENASHLGLPVVPEEIGLTRKNLIAGLVKAKARAARFSWFDKYKISPLDAERAVAKIFGASSPIFDNDNLREGELHKLFEQASHAVLDIQFKRRVKQPLLSPDDCQLLQPWVLSNDDAAAPAPVAMRNLIASIVFVIRSGQGQSEKTTLHNWVKILSRKFRLGEEAVRSLLAWFNKYVDVSKVSEGALEAFLRFYAESYHAHPYLKSKFSYLVHKDTDNDAKLYAAMENASLVNRTFSEDFIDRRTFFKAKVGEDYFLGLRFGLGESTFGVEMALGCQRPAANPLSGVFFRIGVDSQISTLRNHRLGGVREVTLQVAPRFTQVIGLQPADALLMVALEFAAENGLDALLGIHPRFHPTFRRSESSMPYLKIYNRFGIRKNGNTLGPWNTVTYLKQRLERRASADAQHTHGMRIMQNAFRNLREIEFGAAEISSSPLGSGVTAQRQILSLGARGILYNQELRVVGFYRSLLADLQLRYLYGMAGFSSIER
ncbi:MAG: iron-containing alcohol dehydrogenase, partial [Candidatus Omnitrophota bacterium]